MILFFFSAGILAISRVIVQNLCPVLHLRNVRPTSFDNLWALFLTRMWVLWKLMSTRWLLIIWVVRPSLSRAPLAWKAAWNSVLVIRSLPLVPPVLCLTWFLRVTSYLPLEFLTHALFGIIVQPNSIPALLKKPSSSCWLLIAWRSIYSLLTEWIRCQ